jgi:hypothetical protein
MLFSDARLLKDPEKFRLTKAQETSLTYAYRFFFDYPGHSWHLLHF